MDSLVRLLLSSQSTGDSHAAPAVQTAPADGLPRSLGPPAGTRRTAAACCTMLMLLACGCASTPLGNRGRETAAAVMDRNACIVDGVPTDSASMQPLGPVGDAPSLIPPVPEMPCTDLMMPPLPQVLHAADPEAGTVRLQATLNDQILALQQENRRLEEALARLDERINAVDRARLHEEAFNRKQLASLQLQSQHDREQLTRLRQQMEQQHQRDLFQLREIAELVELLAQSGRSQLAAREDVSMPPEKLK